MEPKDSVLCLQEFTIDWYPRDLTSPDSWPFEAEAFLNVI
jgi:hypothetical protein